MFRDYGTELILFPPHFIIIIIIIFPFLEWALEVVHGHPNSSTEQGTHLFN